MITINDPAALYDRCIVPRNAKKGIRRGMFVPKRDLGLGPNSPMPQTKGTNPSVDHEMDENRPNFNYLLDQSLHRFPKIISYSHHSAAIETNIYENPENMKKEYSIISDSIFKQYKRQFDIIGLNSFQPRINEFPIPATSKLLSIDERRANIFEHIRNYRHIETNIYENPGNMKKEYSIISDSIFKQYKRQFDIIGLNSFQPRQNEIPIPATSRLLSIDEKRANIFEHIKSYRHEKKLYKRFNQNAFFQWQQKHRIEMDMIFAKRTTKIEEKVLKFMKKWIYQNFEPVESCTTINSGKARKCSRKWKWLKSKSEYKDEIKNKTTPAKTPKIRKEKERQQFPDVIFDCKTSSSTLHPKRFYSKKINKAIKKKDHSKSSFTLEAVWKVPSLKNYQSFEVLGNPADTAKYQQIVAEKDIAGGSYGGVDEFVGGILGVEKTVNKLVGGFSGSDKAVAAIVDVSLRGDKVIVHGSNGGRSNGGVEEFVGGFLSDQKAVNKFINENITADNENELIGFSIGDTVEKQYFEFSRNTQISLVLSEAIKRFGSLQICGLSRRGIILPVAKTLQDLHICEGEMIELWLPVLGGGPTSAINKKGDNKKNIQADHSSSSYSSYNFNLVPRTNRASYFSSLSSENQQSGYPKKGMNNENMEDIFKSKQAYPRKCSRKWKWLKSKSELKNAIKNEIIPAKAPKVRKEKERQQFPEVVFDCKTSSSSLHPKRFYSKKINKGIKKKDHSKSPFTLEAVWKVPSLKNYQSFEVLGNRADTVKYQQIVAKKVVVGGSYGGVDELDSGFLGDEKAVNKLVGGFFGSDKAVAAAVDGCIRGDKVIVHGSIGGRSNGGVEEFVGEFLNDQKAVNKFINENITADNENELIGFSIGDTVEKKYFEFSRNTQISSVLSEAIKRFGSLRIYGLSRHGIILPSAKTLQDLQICEGELIELWLPVLGGGPTSAINKKGDSKKGMNNENIDDIFKPNRAYRNPKASFFKQVNDHNPMNLIPSRGRDDYESVEKDSVKNGSTLSLHIVAYENANDSIISDSMDANIDDKKSSVIKKWSDVDKVLADSRAGTENPFEFPRQQRDNAGDPELSLFQASQQLLNPNDSAKSGKYLNNFF
uniref:Uncharacterized protein n=1 Tax=Panagrolaimus sp. ES5 TaxID=591445 RepID=A0AC34FWI6_9BILA